MSIDHWMLFSTFAEQEYFEYPRTGTYKGVIINANMASYAPSGLSAFLVEKTAAQTEYIIDPLTHAFQHDPSFILNDKGEPKPSINRLAGYYGSPVVELVGERQVLPEDFLNNDVLQEFVHKCMHFQRNQLADYMKSSSATKYMDDVNSEISPYAIIAPYFFLTETTIDSWLDVNKRAVELALENLEENENCFAATVISRGVLSNPKLRQKVVDCFRNLRVSGYLLWVDDLDEQAANEIELKGLLTLGSELSQNGEKEVINKHGGYFSILAASGLGGNALSGVAHAPEFGEFRSVVPVGGGIPISRYYVPLLHARIRYRDAVSMFNSKGWLDSVEAFHKNVCNCNECLETLQGSIDNFTRFGDSTERMTRRRHGFVRIDYPTTDARKRCLKHYLQRKMREYDAASNMSNRDLIDNLEEGVRVFRDAFGTNVVEHLNLWRDIYEKLDRSD